MFAYGTGPRKGIIRVKLQSEVATKVGNAPLMRANGRQLRTGVQTLDASSEKVGAVSIRPMLPYSAKWAAKRAKYGLDRWYEIVFDENVTPEQAAAIFGATPGVQKAETILPMELKEGTNSFRKVSGPAPVAKTTMPFNDPRLSQQWHYMNDGSLAGCVAGADINLFEAWKVSTGLDKVVVAIIDGGIDINHEDLKANIWINEKEANGKPGHDDDDNGYIDDVYGWNFCTDDNEIYPHSHGTHVAGTVGAVNNNGIGVAGVAGGDGNPGTGVRLMSVQTFDGRSGVADGDFASAIVYACENGATIAQCSWGWSAEGYVEQAVLEAIDYFTAEAASENMTGGLCIFASGNNGATGEWYPACYPKTVAVGSMFYTNEVAPYSNYGDWVDVVAPGGLLDFGESGGVLSTLPDNSYGYNEGTSMACPHVSGIAALILSKHGKGTLTNEALRQQLVTSVKDLYAFNPGKEGLHGSGYIDAAKALVMGDGTAPAPVTDLSVVAAQDMITFEWTIPSSSDNNVNNHIIYYSTEPFTAETVSKAKTVVVDSKFAASGDKFTYELTGLSATTTYHVAIKAVNRWGNGSPLSSIISIKTNKGPKMSVSATTLSFTVDATKSLTSAGAKFTISNKDEGLLKWDGLSRTTNYTIATKSTNRVLTQPFNGKLAAKSIVPYELVTSDYFVGDYPKQMNYGSLYAFIGESDATLPNSMAQMFTVDATEYPDGFNLTGFKVDGAYGSDPILEIYQGGLQASHKIATVPSSTFYFGGVNKLTEQLYFAPGESFYIVAHFPVQEAMYPLGLAEASATNKNRNSYMSNDNGNTWMKLTDVLKGSRYESIGDAAVWAITPIMQNPDWSKVLVLNPAQGTLKMNEQQEVVLTNDGQPLVNGTYKFNVRFKTNETAANSSKIATTLTVSGNEPQMTGPKVVSFGDILVGQSKTVEVEVMNEGYGVFGGSTTSAALNSTKIKSTSPHFSTVNYIAGGFPARATTKVQVTYKPTSAGSHTGSIVFTDKNKKEFKLTVQGVATDPAKITLTPGTVEVGTLTVGTEVKKSFSVKNDGNYPLEFVLPKFSNKQVDGYTSKAHQFGYAALSNLNGSEGFVYAPATLLAPTEITSVFNDDNYWSKEVSLGFAFPFYGKTYEKVYINSFGGIAFGIGESSLRSPLAPTSTSIQGYGYISAYGRELKFAPDSKVSYAKQDGKFVIAYENVLALVYDKTFKPISFHITLSANGDVEMFYDNYNAQELFQDGSTLYCGLLDPAYSDPITVTSADIADYFEVNDLPEGDVYKQFTSQSAVKFAAPKQSFIRSVSSSYGIVNPGEEAIIEATLLADEKMYAGETFNNLVILSNDPADGTSVVRFDAVIEGDMLQPQAVLENNAISFGKVMRGSVAKLPVTVKNNGQRAFSITAVALNNEAAISATVENLPIVVEPGMSKDIVLTLNTAQTTNPTELNGNIEVTTTEGVLTASVEGVVIGAPIANVNIDAITETVESGTPWSSMLAIENKGDENLVYSVLPDGLVNFTAEVKADSKVGYAYTASTDDKNVEFNWIDITENPDAEHKNFTYYNTTNDYSTVELPFEFTFYGKKYSTMYIFNTGFVSFTKYPNTNMWPEPVTAFPKGTIFTNVIAPYWGLHTMSQAKYAGTYFLANENEAIISWIEYGNTMNMNVCFQLILRKNGTFKFQYTGMGAGAVIYNIFGMAGISNEGGTEGFKLSERYVSFGTAVEFTPVVESIVEPGAKVEMPISINTAKMAGEYSSVFKINTNDPVKEKVTIPVNLTVTGEAKPVFPGTIVIERIMGSMDDPTSPDAGPITQMGAFYEAYFKVQNQGTAPFTIEAIEFEGPKMYDEYFDEYIDVLQFWCKMEGYDMFGEPTGELAWGQYMPGMPIVVGAEGAEFSIPMTDYNMASMPGEYDAKATFYYGEGESAVVNVKFVVTPAPYMSIDKPEIAVYNVASDFVSQETVTITNEGEYKLNYTVKIDPTGVGFELGEDDMGGGGIMPWTTRYSQAAKMAPKTLSVAAMDKLPAKMVTMDTEEVKSRYDEPRHDEFEYNRSLYHPAYPGATAAYTYGSGDTYNTFKAATNFVAPADGFNISHIYTAVNLKGLTNAELKVEVVRGSDPDYEHSGSTVIASGKLMAGETSSFVVIPLDRSVFMNPGEEFYVVITYPKGTEWPAYLCNKEEGVVSNRYMGYKEGYGWFDLGTFFEDTYGSLGYIMTCVETHAGDAWVKLLTEEKSGVLEVGESKTFTVQLSAAEAPLELNNRAVLMIESNDPSQLKVNFPITLSKNTTPTILGPVSTIYAQEATPTTVEIVVQDMEMDNVAIEFFDASGLAKVKGVELDANSQLMAEGFAAFEVEINAQYGDAGEYAFSITATDANGNESQKTYNYIVEHTNRAPEAAEMETLTIALGGVSSVINYDAIFSDPDGDEMTYTLALSANDVAVAFKTDRSVIFQGVKKGAVNATLTATDKHGASTTVTLPIEVSEATGIEEVALNAKVSVYPNPVVETLYVTTQFAANDVVYAIYAANGVKVYETIATAVAGEPQVIDVTSLAEGVYVLKITAEDATASFAVVKK